MNAAFVPPHSRPSGGVLRFLCVYVLLPGFCLLFALVIVVLQFVNAPAVFGVESLPLYRQWRLFTEQPQPIEEEESSAPLLAAIDLPSDALPYLLELPAGVHPIVETTISLGGGLINATQYSADLFAPVSTVPAPTDEDGPLVLVLHTHATECYFDPSASPVQSVVAGQSASVFGYYDEKASLRSTDNKKNVVEVGRVFCEALEERGISTVHCQTQHDLDYSNAYKYALDSINEYLEKYPTIRYIIDLHRDSLVRDGGEKLKPTATVNGQRVAQVMLVVGAGSDSLPQPDWRENLAMSARYQSYLRNHGDGFVRPVYLRYGRFNQHKGKGTMLLEVGSCGNTLEEACRAGKLAASSLADMIEESA